jgi:hypothetical protein
VIKNMAYIVTRNNKSGYVALVEKRRVPVAGNKTSVRNVEYVCGLGVMTQSEFEEFRAWAHGITHQESRKKAVLACPRVIKKIDKTTATIAEAQQEKTTVKRAARTKKVVSDEKKQEIRLAREKEWLETLTPQQKKERKEKQIRNLRETQEELKDRFKHMSQIHGRVKPLPVYEIEDLTYAQELEAEITEDKKYFR